MMGGGGVSNLGAGGPGYLGPLGPTGENLLCLGFIPLVMISCTLATATVRNQMSHITRKPVFGGL